MQCGHCGNTTGFDIVGTCNYPAVKEGWLPGDTVVQWRDLRCPVCGKANLDQTLTSYGATSMNGRAQLHTTSPEVLYPEAKEPLKDLPEPVAKAYMRALKVRNVEPNSCATQLGRTLEAVCKQEGTAGRDLQTGLNKLAEAGRIPPLLAEMAQTTREFRNLGAHEDKHEDEVSAEDVPVIFDFVDAILEYLYVAPAKINAVKARLAQRKVETTVPTTT